MRGRNQNGLAPVKDRNGATISDKDGDKEGWAKQFENVLNQDRVIRKGIEENEKIFENLNMGDDIFCEEESPTILKGLKNNKPPGVDSMVNECLKYGGCDTRNKLLKIMNTVFEKRELPSDFRKTN